MKNQSFFIFKFFTFRICSEFFIHAMFSSFFLTLYVDCKEFTLYYFSEAVKGCYPLNGTLPGVLAALVPAARCDLSPEEGDSTVPCDTVPLNSA